MRIGILSSTEAYETSRLSGGPSDHLPHSLQRHEKTNHAVAAALEASGHEAVCIAVDATLMSRLLGARVDMVFNTYFGPANRGDQAYVASLMEYADIPFTGGGAACHFVGLSKSLSKRVFQASGIPTPRFLVAEEVASPDSILEASGLEFPIIVKTSREGEGIGLDDRSVVRSTAELASAVERVIVRFRQAALVEQFIAGRELTVGVLDGNPPIVLPILELMLGEERIYSYEEKVSGLTREECPASLDEVSAAQVMRLAVSAGRSIGCRDYWRVDFRVDRAGEPFVVEVNTLPGLQPDYSDFPKMATVAGVSYEGMVRAILQSAARRGAGRGSNRPRASSPPYASNPPRG